MNTDTHFASAKSDWQTPPEILKLVRKVGPIAFDPATTPDNPTCADFFRTPEDSGLRGPWPTEGLVYANPPYGTALRKDWTPKITSFEGECLALLPARTDTKWFARFVDWADWIVLYQGRIKFVGAKHTAPFPSAFAYRGPRAGAFAQVFGPKGHLMPGTRTLAALTGAS